MICPTSFPARSRPCAKEDSSRPLSTPGLSGKTLNAKGSHLGFVSAGVWPLLQRAWAALGPMALCLPPDPRQVDAPPPTVIGCPEDRSEGKEADTRTAAAGCAVRAGPTPTSSTLSLGRNFSS